MRLPEITGKDRWWEDSLRKFEPTLPQELRRNLDYIFAVSKHDSDDEDLQNYYNTASNQKAIEEDKEMIKLEDQSVKSQASPLSSRAIIGKGDALKTDESNEEEFFLEELSSNDNQREGSIVDEIASQRQRVRFNAIDEKTSPKLSVFGRQKTTILGRQT